MQHYSWIWELKPTRSQQSHAWPGGVAGMSSGGPALHPLEPLLYGLGLQWGITASWSSRPRPADLWGCPPAPLLLPWAVCPQPGLTQPSSPLQSLPCNAMPTYFGGWRSAAQPSAAQGPQSAVTASLGSALDFSATAST